MHLPIIHDFMAQSHDRCDLVRLVMITTLSKQCVCDRGCEGYWGVVSRWGFIALELPRGTT